MKRKRKKYVKKLIEKYKDIIPYTIFGILTTAVNVVSYWFCAHICKFGTMTSTIIAWFLAVLFAYLTNRQWVFHSEANTKKEIENEVISFYVCRLLTGIVDLACMWLFVDILSLNDVYIKVFSNILVIILNYVASKLIIFKKKGK